MQATGYMPTGLDAFFAAVIVISLAVLAWSNLPSRRQRRRSRSGGSGIKHIFNFVLGMALCFGMVGLLAVHGGAIYQALDGRTFLGTDGALGDEGFVGLLAFVIGVPVALAGSIYAVLLAYQSIALTERSIEYARKERVDRQREAWDREVAAIARNFLGLAHALQHMNALATSDMERMLFKIAALGRVYRGTAANGNDSVQAAMREVQDHDSTQDLRESFGLVVQAVRNIHAHPRSCRFLEHLVSARLAGGSEDSQPELFASQLLALGRQSEDTSTRFFETESQREWLAYADPGTSQDERVDTLVDCLAMLQIQAQRITPADLLVAAVRTKVDDAIVNLREGEKVRVSSVGIHEAFYGDWLSTVTRKREPDYFIGYWLRTLLDIGVCTPRKSGFGTDRRDVGVADVVVTDLHLLIPDRKALQAFLRVEAKAWDELDKEMVGKLIDDIEYPARPSLSAPARQWLGISSVSSEEAGSRCLLRFPFSPNPDELVTALGSGEAAFLALWVGYLRKEAEEVLAGDLWALRSSQGLAKATRTLDAMGELAGYRRDDFNAQWHLAMARYRSGGDARLDAAETRNLYDLAIDSATQAGSLAPEQELGYLVEAGRTQDVVARMQQIAAAGGVVDWVGILQACFEGLLTRGVPLMTGSMLVLPAEVGARDGLLPLFLVKLAPRLSRMPKLAGDADGLVGLVACPDPVAVLPFDVATIRDDMQALLDALPPHPEGGEARHLDDLAREWDGSIRDSAALRAMLVPGA